MKNSTLSNEEREIKAEVVSMYGAIGGQIFRCMHKERQARRNWAAVLYSGQRCRYPRRAKYWSRQMFRATQRMDSLASSL